MKKHSFKGTFILGIAGVFAKFLGLFFRWPLIMLIEMKGRLSDGVSSLSIFIAVSSEYLYISKWYQKEMLMTMKV